jgi:hypothetical protein
MIELTNTSDTVVMLAIAAGAGLLGGLGAALLELRRPGEAACRFSWCSLISSILLGAIAAVAILYFFPPTQETVSTAAGGETVTTEYDLTKLVALALIVGSAGPAFLAALQSRTLALANAEQVAAATQATAKQAVSSVADQAATLAKAGVSAAATQIQETLQQAGQAPLSGEQVNEVVNQLADQAQAAVADGLEPHVESAQRSISAAATPSAEG